MEKDTLHELDFARAVRVYAGQANSLLDRLHVDTADVEKTSLGSLEFRLAADLYEKLCLASITDVRATVEERPFRAASRALRRSL